MSHPSRVCGLKLGLIPQPGQRLWSHPSRVCGLKLRRLGEEECPACVTPFTGVWIEIGRGRGSRSGSGSHPSRVCGLK